MEICGDSATVCSWLNAEAKVDAIQHLPCVSWL